MLLQQETRHYTEHPNGVVWDPRVRENMKNYFRLTETEVRDWGSGQVLHTIGLAERDIFRDRKKNLNLKLFTYRRILQEIRERWPQAKILLATWDFVGYWQKDEIAALLKELNPENTLLLDYANDGNDPEHCLAGWGIMGRFPYTFGMFQSGESGSSIRGRYDLIAERLKASAEDPMCKGMVFWPEMSHSDILALEFLARNSWKPDQTDAEKLAESLSRDRYGAYAGIMNDAWQAFLPIVKRFSWGHCTRKPDDPDYVRYAGGERYANYLFNMLAFPSLRGIGEDQRRWMTWECADQRKAYRNAEETLRALAQLPPEAFLDPFVYRDTVDIARSLLETRIHHGIMVLVLAIDAWKQGLENTRAIEAQMEALRENAELHCAVIGCHEDYSMHYTMERMKKTCPVNPAFEVTLKRNLVNWYCRQAAYEPEKKLFLAEGEAYFAWVRENLRKNIRGDWEWTLDGTEDTLYEQFMAVPLAALRPDCDRAKLPSLLKEAAEKVGKIRLDILC